MVFPWFSHGFPMSTPPTDPPRADPALKGVMRQGHQLHPVEFQGLEVLWEAPRIGLEMPGVCLGNAWNTLWLCHNNYRKSP